MSANDAIIIVITTTTTTTTTNNDDNDDIPFIFSNIFLLYSIYILKYLYFLEYPTGGAIGPFDHLTIGGRLTRDETESSRLKTSRFSSILTRPKRRGLKWYPHPPSMLRFRLNPSRKPFDHSTIRPFDHSTIRPFDHSTI